MPGFSHQRGHQEDVVGGRGLVIKYCHVVLDKTRYYEMEVVL